MHRILIHLRQHVVFKLRFWLVMDGMRQSRDGVRTFLCCFFEHPAKNLFSSVCVYAILDHLVTVSDQQSALLTDNQKVGYR